MPKQENTSVILKYAKVLGQLALYSASFCLVFLTTKAIFSFLGTDDYAVYVIVLSISLFIRIGWHNVFVLALGRYYPFEPKEGEARAYFVVLILATLGPLALFAILGTAALLLPFSFTLGDIRISEQVFVAGAILGATAGSNAIIAEIENISLRRLSAALTMCWPGAVLLAVVLLNGWMDLTITTAVMLSSGMLAAISITQLTMVGRRLAKESPSADWFDRAAVLHTLDNIVKFSIPLLLGVLPAILMRVLDKWIAAQTTSTFQIALFGVLVTIGQSAFAAVLMVLNRTFLPAIYRQAQSGEAEQVRKAHRTVDRISLLLFALGVMSFAITAPIAGFLLQVVSTREYASYGHLLSIMLLASSIYMVGDSNSLHGQVRRNLMPYLLPATAGPVVYIILVAVLSSAYGVEGLVYSYLASASLYAGLSLIVSYATRHDQTDAAK